MSDESFLKRTGIQNVIDKTGYGTLIGAGIAGGVALLSASTGFTVLPTWLSWLLVPIATVAGAITGDAIAKDGPIYGENGMVSRFRDRHASIPEGYIAADSHAYVIAVDSTTLARTGEMHRMKMVRPSDLYLGNQELRALDSFVEFSLKGDSRLEALKENARKYGERYAYIPNVQARERAITNAIINDIGTEYGTYSDSLPPYVNKEEFLSQFAPERWLKGARTTELKNMTKNSLVCRQYAPIASILLEEAGVKNHLVSSYVGDWDYSEAHGMVMDDVSPFALHCYVITDEGNAIVEATCAGKDYAEEWGYNPIYNKVTVDGIVYEGKSAIAANRRLYGGHDGSGMNSYQRGISNNAVFFFEASKEAQTAMQESVNEYNKMLRREKAEDAEQQQKMEAAVKTYQALEKGVQSLGETLKSTLPLNLDGVVPPSVPKIAGSTSEVSAQTK